uniref:Exonuclease domain-containing protein n=1 Tax=Rhabditophanes sp. KR3021 TaxID=114890 RepID=A0AC35U374_9BILA
MLYFDEQSQFSNQPEVSYAEPLLVSNNFFINLFDHSQFSKQSGQYHNEPAHFQDYFEVNHGDTTQYLDHSDEYYEESSQYFSNLVTSFHNYDQNDFTSLLFEDKSSHFQTFVSPNNNVQRNYKYFVVVDFEATCEAKVGENYKHEIIEFPALLVDAQTFAIIDTFHSYVKPLCNSKLSTLCKKLTGIKQAQVDNSPYLNKVWSRFTQWLSGYTNSDLENSNSNDFLMITDGHNDLAKFLFQNLELFSIKPQNGFSNYGDLRTLVKDLAESVFGTNVLKMNLKAIIESFGLEFEGKAHSGIDDAINITKLLEKAARKYDLPVYQTHQIDTSSKILTYGTETFVFNSLF